MNCSTRGIAPATRMDAKQSPIDCSTEGNCQELELVLQSPQCCPKQFAHRVGVTGQRDGAGDKTMRHHKGASEGIRRRGSERTRVRRSTTSHRARMLGSSAIMNSFSRSSSLSSAYLPAAPSHTTLDARNRAIAMGAMIRCSDGHVTHFLLSWR